MANTRQDAPMTEDAPTPEEAAAEAKFLHLIALRQARRQHKAIALELQTYFDSVASEEIPDKLLVSLENAEPLQPEAPPEPAGEPRSG
jgi:hypothetical protein